VRAAHDGEIKRMGDEPAVIELVADDAVIQIAAHGRDQDLVLAPYRGHAGRDAAGGAVPDGLDRPRSGQAEGRLASAAPGAAGSDKRQDH